MIWQNIFAIPRIAMTYIIYQPIIVIILCFCLWGWVNMCCTPKLDHWMLTYPKWPATCGPWVWRWIQTFYGYADKSWIIVWVCSKYGTPKSNGLLSCSITLTIDWGISNVWANPYSISFRNYICPSRTCCPPMTPRVLFSCRRLHGFSVALDDALGYVGFVRKQAMSHNGRGNVVNPILKTIPLTNHCWIIFASSQLKKGVPNNEPLLWLDGWLLGLPAYHIMPFKTMDSYVPFGNPVCRGKWAMSNRYCTWESCQIVPPSGFGTTGILAKKGSYDMPPNSYIYQIVPGPCWGGSFENMRWL